MSSNQSQQTSGMSPFPGPTRMPSTPGVLEVGETEAPTRPGSPISAPPSESSTPPLAYITDGRPVRTFSLPIRSRPSSRPGTFGVSSSPRPASLPPLSIPDGRIVPENWSPVSPPEVSPTPGETSDGDISDLNDDDLRGLGSPTSAENTLILSRVNLLEGLFRGSQTPRDIRDRWPLIHFNSLHRRISEADGTILPNAYPGAPRIVRPRANSNDWWRDPITTDTQRAAQRARVGKRGEDPETDSDDPRALIRRRFIHHTNRLIERQNQAIIQGRALRTRLGKLEALKRQEEERSQLPRPTSPAGNPLPQPHDMMLINILDPKIREQVALLNEEVPWETVRNCYEAITVARGNFELAQTSLMAEHEGRLGRYRSSEREEPSSSSSSPSHQSASGPDETAASSHTTTADENSRGRSRFPRLTHRPLASSSNRTASPQRGFGRDVSHPSQEGIGTARSRAASASAHSSIPRLNPRFRRADRAGEVGAWARRKHEGREEAKWRGRGQ